MALPCSPTTGFPLPSPIHIRAVTQSTVEQTMVPASTHLVTMCRCGHGDLLCAMVQISDHPVSFFLQTLTDMVKVFWNLANRSLRQVSNKMKVT